jgi:hypothetical protein
MPVLAKRSAPRSQGSCKPLAENWWFALPVRVITNSIHDIKYLETGSTTTRIRPSYLCLQMTKYRGCTTRCCLSQNPTQHPVRRMRQGSEMQCKRTRAECRTAPSNQYPSNTTLISYAELIHLTFFWFIGQRKHARTVKAPCLRSINPHVPDQAIVKSALRRGEGCSGLVKQRSCTWSDGFL